MRLYITRSPAVNIGLSHNEADKHKSLGLRTFNFPGPSVLRQLNRILESASHSFAYIHLAGIVDHKSSINTHLLHG